MLNCEEINKNTINKKNNKIIMAEALDILKKLFKNLIILNRLKEKMNINEIKTFKVIF